MNTKRIILASSSPRRIEMIKANGIEPIIIPPDVDETLPQNTKPHDAVLFLALKKALHVEAIALERKLMEHIVISADTIVVFNNTIIGKPASEKEAFDMLTTLNGQAHTVLTGVCLINVGTHKREVFYESTEVLFKTYSSEELIEYIKTPEPYDKAGGYAIQGVFGKYIDRINGSYTNVVGFPWERIEKALSNYLK